MNRILSFVVSLCLIVPPAAVSAAASVSRPVTSGTTGPSAAAQPALHPLWQAEPFPGLGSQLLNPQTLAAPDPMALMTGSVTRAHPEGGPIRRMWFIYQSVDEWNRARPMLARIQEANPGVKIIQRWAASALPKIEDDGTLDTAEAERLARRLEDEEIDFVLGSNHDIYEAVRSLRDSGYARELPMGFAGRRFVNVDIPRASLNPEALSDPRTLENKKYLVLSSGDASPSMSDMEGSKVSLADILKTPQEPEPRVPFRDQNGLLAVWLSGEADPREVREFHRQVRHLAEYLENNEIDVLLTDDPQAAKLISEMKHQGYHLSLPVLWHGSTHQPFVINGINALVPSREPLDLARAVRAAGSLERLPANFADAGGVPVQGFEDSVDNAVSQWRPRDPKKGEIGLLLSSGTGKRRKGDSNAWGHFGMSITDDKGKHRVWTVHYNDRRGGTFTGGLGDSQLTLGEYLYGQHYHPGVGGQATALAETSAGPVQAVILREIPKTTLDVMREKAAFINARHLMGKDSYSFLNKNMLTNCISMVTQLLRSAGFRIAESGTQAPADKAVEMIRGLGRWLLEGRIQASQFDVLTFDRPWNAASDYRIPNVPMGSYYIDFQKPWKKMTWLERLYALLHRPFEFLKVPATVKAFSEFATLRLVVDPNTRRLRSEINDHSPIAKLSRIPQQLERLEAERVAILTERQALQASLLKRLGLEDWRVNPEVSALAERRRGELELTIMEQAELDRELAEHHDLDVRLKTNLLTSVLYRHEETFLKLRIADPLGFHRKELYRARTIWQRAVNLRWDLERENRLPTPAEVAQLTRWNTQVEEQFHRLRAKLLSYFGPPVPLDVETIFTQVTAEDFTRLKEGQDGGGAKGKSEPSL